MIPLSVLDLSPIVLGGTAADSLRNTLDLARHAERWGYHRYWLAEHHGMPGIASAATAVVIGHVADGTSAIRVGAGGIMLPNHAPLVVAEQFGTLESLHPGRIDLGLGRAPGSDPTVARALRRDPMAGERFADDVLELLGYFASAESSQGVRAVPGAGLDVPVWILGSSLYGAQVAAALGLPYAFASHFAPRLLHEAIALYRARFRPSVRLARPYVMLGVTVVAAETDELARYRFTSLQQAFVNLRTGRPGPVPPPVADYEAQLTPVERAAIAEPTSRAIVGSVETVRQKLQAFIAETNADELMITSQLFEHAARLRSYEIVADVHGLTAARAA